jgi:hypothetical protein
MISQQFVPDEILVATRQQSDAKTLGYFQITGQQQFD